MRPLDGTMGAMMPLAAAVRDGDPGRSEVDPWLDGGRDDIDDPDKDG